MNDIAKPMPATNPNPGLRPRWSLYGAPEPATVVNAMTEEDVVAAVSNLDTTS
jgi:hypothetical protein